MQLWTIALVAGFFLALSGSIQAQPLTGTGREQLVSSGTATCTKQTRDGLLSNEDFYKKAGISADRIGLYCHCMMEYMADVVSPAEMSDLLSGGDIDVDLKAKIQLTCSPLLKTVTR